jgi:hypothetical protein
MGKGFTAMVRSVRRGELSWSGLVSQEQVDQACQRAGYKSWAKLFNPFTTLVTFLSQLLSEGRACQRAVDGLIAERVAAGKPKNSTDTGGFCKARKRIPEAVYWDLARQSGQSVENEADAAWHWRGHRVRVADGSTLHVLDTKQTLQEYPLQQNLTPGLHYSLVRILVVFSLAVGTVLDAAINPYQGKGTGETAMLRSLAGLFDPGDVLLADRYFSGYWDLAFWAWRGVWVVTRLPASRRADFRKGVRLGKDDHLIPWHKPRCPDWISPDEAEQGPSTLTLREVRVRVSVKGFRTKVIVIVTTLLDAEKYPKDALAELYRLRWQAELNLRSLKTHLDMDYLSCKTPEMLRREFATYLLAYNSIRKVSAEAACHRGVKPLAISFTHTQQSILEFFPRLHSAVDREHWIVSLLETVAEILVGNRPGRIEPYTSKKRPKDYPPPKETRQKYKRRKMK